MYMVIEGGKTLEGGMGLTRVGEPLGGLGKELSN